ncbi:hypothetical protein [Kosmotoga pacifica]|uniref:Methyltransferase type 11 domain-containing protein n=1 Tax=Kosmotoga pacifica TaxID=1330330 RepID=A0A0G2Z8T1_9BACT|nr:hypothetical protein [Kosmotoga pacifica]AKI97967.1 hypothetical protein IX53_09190 [Kosmotoga pacifica]
MNHNWRRKYLEAPPGLMSKTYTELYNENTLRDYITHFAASTEKDSVILDIDCSGCSFWKYLRETGIKIIGVSVGSCKSKKIPDRGIRILKIPFSEISFIGIFGGFLFLFAPNFLPPDVNLEILKKAHLALRLGGKGLIAIEVERNSADAYTFSEELRKSFPVIEGDRLINGKYRFIPTVDSVKNLIHLAGFQLIKYTLKGTKAFFLVRK